MSTARGFRSILCLLLALAPCTMLRAAEAMVIPAAGWYRVEVVIFERVGNGSDTGTEEILLTHAARTFSRDAVAFDDDAGRAGAYPLDAETRASMAPGAATQASRLSAPSPSGATGTDPTAAPADFESRMQQRSFRFEPSSSLLLTPQVGRLQRNPAYRVLFHHAWIQPVPDRDQLLPMLIQVGDRIDSRWRIEGILGVTRGRYLHLDTRLWYAIDPGSSADPAQPPGGNLADGGADDTGYMELREQRRMRSGELHYLDHPKFGVLARVDPVLPP